MKKLLAFLPLALFAALGMALAIGLTRDPAKLPSVLIDRPVPAFELAPVRAGEPGFASEDLKGKVVLLNVFGSWCVGCRIEHPLLMQIEQRGEATIYGLNWKDKPEDGAAWLSRFGDPYERVGADLTGRAALDLGVAGAPETFVINKQGRIVYKHIGLIDEETWRTTLLPLVKKLEAER
jgi:cytochrome c biogenesis protein CcmG/thiol:disulfide interchange protein DsbE